MSKRGRPNKKPDYNSTTILQELMNLAVQEYTSLPEGQHPSLAEIVRRISEQETHTGLNPIKIRKLLITAGVYESKIADQVNAEFEKHKEEGYKEALCSTARALQLSRSSVTSYLPYEKVVYMKKNHASVDADRMRKCRERKDVVEKIQNEADLWQAVVAFQDYPFFTASGLPFHYVLKTGRNGKLTKELWIDRREKSKSLAWSSVLMGYRNSKELKEVDRPKALGDIRGVSYIYPILWRFGLIKVPKAIEEKMQGKKVVFCPLKNRIYSGR
jgi:hypothetical protein